MRNIVLTRIDERLIHGQVMTSWLRLCNANVVLIIDGPSAANPFLKRILLAAAPRDIELLVMNSKDAAQYLKEEALPGEKIFILSKVPKPLLDIIEDGVKIHEIILGNMGGDSNRKHFNKNISASAEEIQDFRAIIANGVPIYCQMIPSDSKENINKHL